jgi:hypothetical protein
MYVCLWVRSCASVCAPACECVKWFPGHSHPPEQVSSPCFSALSNSLKMNPSFLPADRVATKLPDLSVAWKEPSHLQRGHLLGISACHPASGARLWDRPPMPFQVRPGQRWKPSPWLKFPLVVTKEAGQGTPYFIWALSRVTCHKTFLKCSEFNQTPTTLHQDLCPVPWFKKLCIFLLKFDPHVPDLFTIKSSK